MTKFRLSILLFLLTLLSSVFAQPYCEVRTFNIRDGLAGNVISGIAEDKNHMMWFTTWNGLCYYDGYQFTTFRDMRGSDRILTTNRMLHLFSDDNGNVWATTYDLRLFMFDTRKCQFVDVSAIIKRRYGIDVTTTKFMRGAKGTVWAMVEGNGHIALKMDGNLVGDGQGVDMVRFDRGRLKGAKVERVAVDSKQREWIFTDKGVCTKDFKTVLPHRYENLIPIGGKLYFYSSCGQLALYDERTARTKQLLNEHGMRFNKVRTMGDQRLVVATDRGILLYDLRTGSRRLVSVQNPAQPCAEVTDLYLDSKKRVWAFGKGPGMTLLDMTTLAVRWMNKDDDNCRFVTDGESTFFHEDTHHTVWVMPGGGAFCYFDEKSQSLVPYSLQLQGGVPLRNLTIRKVYKDHQGNAWIAGNHDLALINFKYRQFKFISVESADCEIRSVKTLSNGNLLVGTGNGYVQVRNALKEVLGYLTPGGGLSHAPVKLTACKVMTFMEDHRHRLWIGTRGDGIYLLDGGTMRHFTKASSLALSSNDIFDFCEDKQGHIWIATWKGGINLVDERDGNITFLSAVKGLKSYPISQFPRVRRLTLTRDGVVIGSASTGIFTFSSKFNNPSAIKYYGQFYDHNDTTTLATGDVMQACVMRTGRIFVSTLGGCLQELASRSLLQSDLDFSRVRMMPQTIVEGMGLSMVEDRKGQLWVVHESDISVYNPDTKQLQQYGPNYLGENRELTEAKPDINSRTGEIILGAQGGIVVFNPNTIMDSPYVPKIVFTNIQYQGDETEHPILNTPELYVPSDRRSFNVNFAALDYANNYMVKYAYKLEGVDKEWNYLGSHLHSASYSNFPAGHYRLLVRSTNADGVWTDNVATLNIYAQPSFWETIWAKILYVVIILAVLYSAKRYYDMRNKTRTLHAMVNQLLEEYNNRSVQAQESEEKQRQNSPEIYHLPPSEILDSDQQMMMKLMDFLSQNIGNSELKIDELADAVNLSRSVFYSKLKAKVGMTPVEFLKHIRIQKAEELIVRSNESFSQIAYAVGFTDPKYFTKCFKKATGMTPSEYRSSKKE